MNGNTIVTVLQRRKVRTSLWINNSTDYVKFLLPIYPNRYNTLTSR